MPPPPHLQYNILSVSIPELLVKVKLPESLQNSKTLYKLEKLMTTQRELVEELRLDIADITIAAHTKLYYYYR